MIMIRSFKQEKSYLKRQITKVKNLSKKFDGVSLYFAIDLSKRDVFDRMGRAVRTSWSEDEKKEYHKLGVDYLKVAFEIRDKFYVNSKGAIIEVVDWNVSEFGGDDFFNPTTIEFEIKVWDRNLEVFYTDTIETYISCYGWMCDFMEDESIYLRERIEENDRDSVPDIDLPLYDYLKEHDENFWDEHCDELFYQMRTDEEFKVFCLEKISFLYWDDGCKVSEWTGDFDPQKLFGKFEPMGVKEDVLYPLF